MSIILEISRIKLHFSRLSHMEPKNLPGSREPGARWSGPLEDKAVFNGAQSLKETKSMKMPVSTKWDQKFHIPPNCLQIPDQWVTHIQYLKLYYFLRCIFVNFLHKASIKSFINYVTFLQIKTWIKIYKITFEVELAQSMIRQVVMYFSMVRRRACWASLLKWSTSVITTTLNSLSLVVVVICCAELNKMEKNLVKSNSIKDFY